MEESRKLSAEDQLLVQGYLNNYLTKAFAIIGGANIVVVLGAIFYLYSQGISLVQREASTAVQQAIDQFELNDRLADRLIALGAAEQAIIELAERASGLEEIITKLEADSSAASDAIQTIAGTDSETITNVAELLRTFEDGLDQALYQRVSVIEDQYETLNGRVWRRVIDARRLGTEYVNDREYAIHIAVTVAGGSSGDASNSCDLQLFVDGARIAYSRDNWTTTARICFGYAIVPAGSRYRVVAEAWRSNSGRIVNWHEFY